jgi:D-alanyl-D-alanine carboxypeptidase (penicillin-binding protein 5/6)
VHTRRALTSAALALGLLLVVIIEAPRPPLTGADPALPGTAALWSRQDDPVQFAARRLSVGDAAVSSATIADAASTFDPPILTGAKLDALLSGTPQPVILLPTERLVAAWGAAPHSRQLPPPDITARSAVVLDEPSMAVLYDKDARERRAPASLTKVVTAAIAVQHGDLDHVAVNTIDARDMPGSSLMGLRPDDEFALRDLLYGMMLRSGNDAARAIALELAPSEEDFVQQMNLLVMRLGLRDTHFTDPHGLGGVQHYSTAYDLAILARYAMQFPELSTVVNARAWTAEGSRTVQMKNLNPFMDLYEGGDGMKTGYTEAAGPTFIGSAVHNGHRLYVVLLNSSDRWSDAAALLDWAFENHIWQNADALVTLPDAPAQLSSAPDLAALAVAAEAEVPDDGIVSAARAIEAD